MRYTWFPCSRINVSKYMIYPDVSHHPLIEPLGNARCLSRFPEVHTVSTATTESRYMTNWWKRIICPRSVKRAGNSGENLGPVSISEKTSYCKISWSLEAARFVFRICSIALKFDRHFGSIANFKAIRQFKIPISLLRDFARSYDKTSFRILRRAQIITMILMPSCLPPLALQVW